MSNGYPYDPNQKNYPPLPQNYNQNYPPPQFYPMQPYPPQNYNYQNVCPSQMNQNFPPPSYGYYQQYFPPPQQSFPDNTTSIHGLVIGYTKDSDRNYLFYSAAIKDGLIQISHRMELFIGQWIGIKVWSPDFQGQFLLDDSNSSGYEDTDDVPSARYCSAKFFPQREDPNDGELVIMARFGVIWDQQIRSFEIESYDIQFDHIVDDSNLIGKSNEHYHERSFIVELQASLRGWIVLKVHEDPTKQFSCDTLPDALVDFNIQFLEDCEPPLMRIMTGNGFIPQETNESNRSAHRNNFASGGSLGQNQTSISNSSYPSDQSESNLELHEIEQSMSRTTITPVPERSSSSRTVTKHQTERASSPPPRPPLRQEKRKVPVEPDDEIELDDDTVGTLGTHQFPEKQFLKHVSGQTYQRFQAERARNDGPVETALCTVVQHFDGIALLYTAKRDVLNVLVYENKCEGVEDVLQLGQVAFFEIQPRRNETQDELLPRAPYTHIAVRMLPITPESQEKIDYFKKSVRCFGGLVEMKVKIQLTKENQVDRYYDNDELIKSESDRKFLFLRATNGVFVSIPFDRLIGLLKADMTADFDLIAWVSHRKAVGNVSLHIGKNGEAWQKFNDNRKIEELPPV